MKKSTQTFLAFALLIVAAALYRIVPGRPFGFEPMIAMAIFGGAVVSDKRLAIGLPLFAMLLSDLLYEGFTRAGILQMPGFYEGQWVNYLLIAGLTLFGIFIRRVSFGSVASAALVAPLVYFLLSNTAVWMSGGGYARPLTGAGWLMALEDGLPFLKWSIVSSLVFCGMLFGAWYALARPSKARPQIA